MTRVHYKWEGDASLATLQPHSVAKHEVLRAYLIDYMRTLVVSPHQEELRVTMIDGFAGGGLYRHAETDEVVRGSPFVFLEAQREAEVKINEGRQKPVRMNVDHFFIDKDHAACDSLTKALAFNGCGPRIGKDIQVLNSAFDAQMDRICDFIAKKSPRMGRSLFFLDQYGYTDVPKPLIKNIFARLPATEIILTFNVDSFINFATDSESTKKTLTDIGIPDVLRGRTIADIKRNERDVRLYIQSCFYRELVEGCGAQYYTVFFIRNEGGHGDYWLVHLSQHHRARDVMTKVHWKKNNHFVHYGGAGIDMFQALGYSAGMDNRLSGQSSLFEFDNPAAERSVAALMEQLPHRIYARAEGLTFGQLFAMTCNTSPADSQKYKDALERLVQIHDIEIISPDGARRYKASTITDHDLLVPSPQVGFGFV